MALRKLPSVYRRASSRPLSTKAGKAVRGGRAERMTMQNNNNAVALVRPKPPSPANRLQRGARVVWHGMVEIGHNSLAVLGLASIALVLFFSSDSALRQQVERQALEWLNLRHGPAQVLEDGPVDLLADLSEPEAVARATARELAEMPRDQTRVTNWIARRYRVAPEAVARLVHEAWVLGGKARLEPTLILAIIAVESSFNPFAQSSVGAQGLMQVMTRVHNDKYAVFGGNLAALDPVTNLRVGVQVLVECIRRAGGGVDEGLKYYVGAANLPDDGGYASRVLAEQGFLKAVAMGQTVALNVDNRVTTTVASVEPSVTLPAVPVVSRVDTGVAPTRAASSSTSSTVGPAAHASPGSVMAPALGAALPENLAPTRANVGTPASTAAAASPVRPKAAASPLPSTGAPATVGKSASPAAPAPAASQSLNSNHREALVSSPRQWALADLAVR
jgi:hypothetical protein